MIPALALIFVIEATFLAANGLKLAHGGYMPVLMGATIIMLMVTWLRGRQALAEKLRKESVELVPLLESLERRQPTRVAGAAVFMQTDPVYAPSALMHNLKHNRVLHDILVFITVETTIEPRLESENRVTVKQLPLGAWLVEARFGYMEQPDVPKALRACAPFGLEIDPRQASLLPRPPRHPHVGPLAHAVLATAHLHHAGQPVCPRHRVLPHPARPGGRTRHADERLTLDRRISGMALLRSLLRFPAVSGAATFTPIPTSPMARWSPRMWSMPTRRRATTS